MDHLKFINSLIGHNWQCEASQIRKDARADDAVEEKLSKAPKIFLQFIAYFDLLAHAEDNIWFISLKDYFKQNDGEGFSWNEFELQSLAYSDEAEKKAVREFWSNHLPFMMSVKGGYSYVAIVLNGENKGQIVAGAEPEYEDTVVLADSLNGFFDKYISGQTPRNSAP